MCMEVEARAWNTFLVNVMPSRRKLFHQMKNANDFVGLEQEMQKETEDVKKAFMEYRNIAQNEPKCQDNHGSTNMSVIEHYRTLLKLVPPHKRRVIEEILQHEDIHFMLQHLVKGKYAVDAFNDFKRAKKGAKPAEREDFLCALAPSARSIALNYLQEGNYNDVEVLLEAATDEARVAFAEWRCRKEVNHVVKSLELLPEEDRATVQKLMEKTDDRNLIDALFRCLLDDEAYAVYLKLKRSRSQSPHGRRLLSEHYQDCQGDSEIPDDYSDAQGDFHSDISSQLDGHEEDDNELEDEDEEQEEDLRLFAPTTLTDADVKTFPDCTNILLLGETGVGKSTFINGIANYLKYASLVEAKNQGGPETLIRTAFTYAPKNEAGEMEAHRILEPKNGKTEEDNEYIEEGQSATKGPHSYYYSLRQGEYEKKIRLIDTAGVGDTKGQEENENKFNKILDYVEKVDNIHAICVVMQANTPRPTLGFRMLIERLGRHFNKAAKKNLVFCFTHARSTGFGPGDSKPVLENAFEEMSTKKGQALKLNNENMYCFDNASLRYLCVLHNGFELPRKEENTHGEYWAHNVTETTRWLKHIATLVAQEKILRKC